MATEKPKLQGYVERELYDRFTQWKSERGIEKDSPALNQLLTEFFGVPGNLPGNLPSDTTTLEKLIDEKLNEKLPSREEIQIAIQQELWGDGKHGFIEGLKAQAQSMISAKVAENQAFWDSIAASGVEMKKVIAQLEARIKALEKSNPPNNLPSNPKIISETDSHSLSGTELAKRLKIDKSLVTKNRTKTKETFGEWTASKDPEGISWGHDPETNRYLPVGDKMPENTEKLVSREEVYTEEQ